MPGPVRVTMPARYGEDRIVAGARFLGSLDPGWWQEGALLPASLAALDMADPYRCLLAWWAARHLPAPARPGARQAPPYDRAVRALRLSPRQAEALGFTGVDANRLTPGWRHLITHLRAPHDRHAAAHPRLHAGLRPTRRAGARARRTPFPAGPAPLSRQPWRSGGRPGTQPGNPGVRNRERAGSGSSPAESAPRDKLSASGRPGDRAR